MNRIENIILTLATAAALLVASTANADTHSNDGLNGIPVVKTPNGTRMARDLELEEANRDSGTKPEDGLPGRPVIRTPNGTRTARDLEAEQANHGKIPCPKAGRDNKRNSNGTRTRTANEAGSLLPHNNGLPLDLNGTRTKDQELADRGAQMGSLRDAARRNRSQGTDRKDKLTNTTLGKTLKRAGIDPDRLDGARTETGNYGHTKITLDDGTEIWTGPDSDGFGTSVTYPNGDQLEVFPDGRVSTRKGKDGNTVTTRRDGTTIVYDPKKKTLTITDKAGNTITKPMTFFDKINRTDMTYDDLMDLLFPGRKGGAANGGKNSKHPKANTTLDDNLRRAGLTRDDLRDATSVEPSEFDGSVKITLKDGTEIWTGPDNDGSGSSVSKPNGDQIEVFPNGAVSTRKGKDGNTITTRPDGFTTTYNPGDRTLTITDKRGNSETRNMEFWNDWFKAGHDAADLLRIYYPEPESN